MSTPTGADPGDGGLQAEDSLQIVLETLPHMAFLIASGGKARLYNSKFLDYHGFIPGDDPASRAALIHPDDLPGFTSTRQSAVRVGQEYTVEARLRRHDGAFRWHRIHNKPLVQGERVTGWLGTAVDIDDMRRAHEILEQRVAERTEELAASEARYRSLYDRTPLALHSVGADATLIDINQSWLDLFGYRRSDVIGRSPSEFMTDASAAHYRGRAWPDMLSSGGDTRAEEYRFIRASGEEFDGRLVSRGEFDGCGRLCRSWSAIIDVTQQKQAEAKLRQMQKIEAIGQLTSGIAHDFNNLLTVIGGNLEMLSRSLAGTGSRNERLLRTATNAVERGARLTAQLLAFARQRSLQPEALDINAVVRGMMPMLRSTIGGSFEITADLEDGIWPALTDGTQLELIILNLGINARDAMSSGGEVVIRTRKVRLGPPQRPEEPAAGDYAMLEISDTGSGISPEIRDRIFEPFFTTKDIGKGSGLGLPQVLGIAQHLGGGVRIHSAEGAGTSVQVFFPKAAGVAG